MPAIWVVCDLCEDLYCRIHDLHVFDCECPAIDYWTVDPRDENAMRDEMRMCECGEEHPWGIVSHSADRTPLYGARAIENCDNFRAAEDTLPAIINSLQELWAQTGDLSPQATAATRAAVAGIKSLAKGKKGYSRLAAQWPEFAGFVISQITDMRGALVRDETKFAHLVAHTDEIVESMRGVAQLSEQLQLLNRKINEVRDDIETLQRPRGYDPEAAAHFGLNVEGFCIGGNATKWVWRKPSEDDEPFDLDEDES